MYLGLDLGTSGLRALLVDENQTPVASAEAGYPVAHPAKGHSEQDPADWLTALATCMDSLRQNHGPQLAALRGIGVSGQMHGAVCLDADGAVLRPAILWNDSRAASQARTLDETPGVRARSGTIVFPGFTAPKLLWMHQHEHEVFARIKTVLLPKDYLNYHLTGHFSGDISDASGTGWFDCGDRRWSADLLAASNMHIGQMPALAEGSSPVGQLRAGLARDWGVVGPVVVAAGAADNAAAACGTGCLAAGRGFLSLGTSGVLLAARNAYAPAPETAVHTFCHATPGRWYQMAVILAATDSLNWLARTLGQGPATLADALPDRISGPGTAMFLPYLSGERTPHNDAKIRAAFCGLDISAGPETLTQAVFEGVAYAFADGLAALKATGAQFETTLAIGGGAQSAHWLELMATVLELPLSLPAHQEYGAALGAARLAICATTAADPASVMLPPRVAKIIPPRDDLVAAYQDKYASWKQLYPALKDIR